MAVRDLEKFGRDHPEFIYDLRFRILGHVRSVRRDRELWETREHRYQCRYSHDHGFVSLLVWLANEDEIAGIRTGMSR